MKLLFITHDFSQYVERNTYYLAEELKKHCELKQWHESGNIHHILGRIDFTPDFILLNDFKESRCPEITGLDSLKIPFGIIMHDLHWKVKKRKKFIEENNVQYIFTIYRDAFLRHFKEYKDRMIWFPHFINPEIFKDYQLQKDIDWLMMGKVAFYYPLRQKILEEMKDRPGFVYYKHPGYKNVSEQEEGLVGKAYAREINRAKIFLTCDSTLHYPIIKYYEVLASNTLLLAPCPNELKALGFMPGKHFVEINEDNFLEKAEYYLKNEKERFRIAEQGYRFIHKNHTVSIRAQELLENIKKII